MIQQSFAKRILQDAKNNDFRLCLQLIFSTPDVLWDCRYFASWWRFGQCCADLSIDILCQWLLQVGFVNFPRQISAICGGSNVVTEFKRYYPGKTVLEMWGYVTLTLVTPCLAFQEFSETSSKQSQDNIASVITEKLDELTGKAMTDVATVGVLLAPSNGATGGEFTR